MYCTTDTLYEPWQSNISSGWWCRCMHTQLVTVTAAADVPSIPISYCYNTAILHVRMYTCNKEC